MGGRLVGDISAVFVSGNTIGWPGHIHQFRWDKLGYENLTRIWTLRTVGVDKEDVI